MMWAAIGFAVMSIVMRIDYRTYRNDKLIWLLLGVVGVMLVAVLFSRPINGTKRWFGIGGFGISRRSLRSCGNWFTALISSAAAPHNELSTTGAGLIVGGLRVTPAANDFGTAGVVGGWR